jgi:cytochrome P450
MATTEETAASGSDRPPFNPFDPQLWVNPHPILKELRDRDPAHLEPALGMCVVTGHEQAEQAFRDPDGDHRYLEYQKMRQGADVEEQPYVKGMSQWVLMRSGADHRRLRGTIAKDFTPGRVERLQAEMVELAHDLIDRFAGEAEGEVEIVEAYGNALPLAIISRLLDVPAEDHARIEHWMEGFKHAVQYLPMSPEELAECNAAISGLHEYFTSLIAERRKNPGDDLLSALIVQADEGAMSEEELIVNAWGLYAAGHETSGNAICDAIHTLLEHPTELQRLLDDWSLLATAVDELLRYDGPGLATNRLFPHELTLGGHTLAAGTPVVLFMAGANHDPAHFEDPERLDLARENAKDHLGFGHGPHRCVGQHMARASIAVALQTLFTRLHGIRIVGEVEWNARSVFHGPRTMRLAWESVSPR